ncbi:MAG: DNA-3-methyladenine glycosylase 2 family protein [Ruminococcus sp.]|nr:DNA-3-methyladenine glycosylase 2 family protein [Ruminococcus sp.]
MDYKKQNNDIILKQADFDLAETLDCGQAFRWKQIQTADGFDTTYSGFFLNKPLTISQKNDIFAFHNTTESDFLNIWADYFDLNTDYGELKNTFSSDNTLKKACEFAGGIRLLKQDSWECLCSFIISQNNNIPRIKGIISRLCEHYGGFPTPKQLAAETVDGLDYLRSGFRAKYIIDASQKVASGIVDLNNIADMDIQEARQSLMLIKGVGKKVAECVLLFGMYRTEAFPVDVWINRVMQEYYPQGIPDCAKNNCGIAQQYLFHYVRNCSDN